jgi:hypothetical protein
MKLIKRKTRKAIQKAVRKAMKKHGKAIMAGLVTSIASSLATLAKAEAPGSGGKSHLAKAIDHAQHALSDAGGGPRKPRLAEKKTSYRRRHAESTPEVELTPS